MSRRPADLTRALDALEVLYGPQTLAGPTDPYQMLLFLNSGYPASDVACVKGFDALKRAVGLDPGEILAAPTATLATAMRAGGIVPEQRTTRLQDIARSVKDEFGADLTAALRKLLRGPATGADEAWRRAKKVLQQFPTIGEPSAEKILLFAKLAPVAAVPSASVDVCTRLWRGEPGKNYAADYRAAREILSAGLPESFAPRQRAYLLLKKHGQQICKRSTPRCEKCPLTGQCAYVRARAMD
jgi:endonuclease-3